MKGRMCIFLLLVCSALLPLAAQEKARVALDDIVVQSAQPQFKFIGKGITELIGVELVKSQTVTLVDREKRVKLLSEIEFGASEAADSAKAAQLGKLLQADYLGFGDAIDMGGKFIFSFKLVKVETGDVVWADKVSESLGNYDYVASFFASSLLKAIKAPVAATTVAKVEQKVEKNEQALVSFSKAVEAVDKKDTATAKTELQNAQKLDPKSDAVAAYLAKLVTNTTKFKVLLDRLYPSVNPAFLGIMRTDMTFLSFSACPVPLIFGPAVENVNYTTIGTGKYINESFIGMQDGYALPIGPNMGLRISIIYGNSDFRGETTISDLKNTNKNDSRGGRGDIGVALDFGWSPIQPISLGIGGGVFLRGTQDTSPIGPFYKGDGATWSMNAGLLYRNADESLVFDTRFGVDGESVDVFDAATLKLTGTTTPDPLLLENTLTLAFNEKHTFLILKQIDSFDYKTLVYYGTLMPAAEQFFFDWLSARAGLEGSLLASGGSTTFGLGGMCGATIRILDWGMDIDFNLTYRQRPSYLIPGRLYNDFMFLVNLSWNGMFVKSRG